MKTPKTPPPPDPVATAKAQTDMNVKTATTQQQLNMVNQYTPEGNIQYTQTGTWADGTPKFEMRQVYSPEQQKLYETGVATEQNLADLAKSQSGFLNDYMAKPADLSASGLSERANALGMPDAVQWTGNIAPTTTSGSWNAERITGGEIPNAERINPIAIGSNENLAQSLFDSAERRMGKVVMRDYDNLQSQLAARGIKPGSAAWDRAQTTFDERLNDQYNQLYVAAQDQAFNQAAQRSQIGFNQALTGSGQYFNQALAGQGQKFDQDLAGQGQYFNQTLAGQQQQFQQDLAAQNTNFNNALQAQTTAYDQAMNTRQQAGNEILTERNQPIQEITALMSGSQVSQPTFANTPKTQVAPVDYTGLVSNIYGTASQNAIAKAQMQNQMMGSVIGAAGNIAGMMAFRSDKRLKKNIQKVGEANGLGVYKYEGKKGSGIGPMQQIGLMAQEVEKKKPEAVLTDGKGVKMVNYAKALGGER